MIDELRIYSRALSGQEIEQNMGAAGSAEATSVTRSEIGRDLGQSKSFQISWPPFQP